MGFPKLIIKLVRTKYIVGVVLPIIGYHISSITAERREISTEKIDINSAPKINSVEQRDMTYPIKQAALAISFEFETTYTPNIGEIRIAGEILYSNKNLKKISEFWDKQNKLPEDIDIEVRNFLFRKCLSLGVNLSENLQLPPPVLFPLISDSQKDNTYIG
ncbi:MAG: hypothetical protein J4452_02325 [Candidatus Aenigmarchaeota archaeon]|nr:hypothetical protein [Candidatus Aenigmarchaeota archaeon]